MWVLNGARAHGVQLRRSQQLRELPSLSKDNALVDVHRMDRRWALATYRHRNPPIGARVHASARSRREKDPSYGHRLRDPVWVDENWYDSPHTTPKVEC